MSWRDQVMPKTDSIVGSLLFHAGYDSWVNEHGDAAESRPAQCQACHGTEYRGTVLSKTGASRTGSTEYGTRTVAKGHVVGCYDCHNGPNP